MRISLMLGRNLPILATVGSIAPFIGLFGTVIGIMRAFQAISVHRAAGIAVVGAGIAEALICTAAGLAVAIVSVVAFNAFKTRSKRLLEEAEVGYLDLLVLLQAGAPKEPEN
jgi:biopolymer transport protein ExbB/TolQ